jgi:hypothetical protein
VEEVFIVYFKIATNFINIFAEFGETGSVLLMDRQR